MKRLLFDFDGFVRAVNLAGLAVYAFCRVLDNDLLVFHAKNMHRTYLYAFLAVSTLGFVDSNRSHYKDIKKDVLKRFCFYQRGSCV